MIEVVNAHSSLDLLSHLFVVFVVFAHVHRLFDFLFCRKLLYFLDDGKICICFFLYREKTHIISGVNLVKTGVHFLSYVRGFARNVCSVGWEYVNYVSDALLNLRFFSRERSLELVEVGWSVLIIWQWLESLFQSLSLLFGALFSDITHYQQIRLLFTFWFIKNKTNTNLNTLI